MSVLRKANSQKLEEIEVSHTLGGAEACLLFLDVVYYQSIKRKLKRRLICQFRCDERLTTKVEGSTRLTS